jgi:hypothetical protein
MYLYIKTHNKTGLKYLGKTSSKDPFKYKGSGLYWKRHIEKHGYDVFTEIIYESDDVNIIKEQGLIFSKLYNIVEDPNWANLKEESGDGGWDFVNKDENIRKTRSKRMLGSGNPFYGKTHTKETKEKLSEYTKKQIFPKRTLEHNEKIKKSLLGKKHSKERCENISLAKKGKPPHNKGIPDLKIECPYCKKIGGRSNMKRWHFENCKFKKEIS